jgi:hypothetical protein
MDGITGDGDPAGGIRASETRAENGPESGPGAPSVHIRTFSLVGGVRILRGGLARPSRMARRSDRRSRRDRFAR